MTAPHTPRSLALVLGGGGARGAYQAGVVRALARRHPDLRALAELLVDLDEGVQEWRYRHVKMVERTIGFKPGTGGSSPHGRPSGSAASAASEPTYWTARR